MENDQTTAAEQSATHENSDPLYGPYVGLALGLALALLVMGQSLMFLYYYGDTLAPTRLPYLEEFTAPHRLDYRQFGGQWDVQENSLVQRDTQDTDLLAVLPNLRMDPALPYHFGATIRVLAGPKGGGLVFNMQEEDSRRASHLVRFGSGEGGDYLVYGYFDEELTFVSQGALPPPELAPAVELSVAVHEETYDVLVNGKPMAQGVPLQFRGGHLALTTWFSSIAFDDVYVTREPMARQEAAAPAPDASQENAAPAQDAAPSETDGDSTPVQSADRPAGADPFAADAPVDRYFTADFGDNLDVAFWRELGGDWQFEPGALVQMMPEGFDHTMIQAGRFSEYTLRARFAHREGVGGGVLFNVPSITANKTGHLVRYMEEDVVAWGYFDDDRVFQGQGAARVPPAGDDLHTLEITAVGDTYAIRLDGEILAQGVPLMIDQGWVGLTASESVVAFTNLEVRPAAD